jgi:hypothetical protein
MGWTMVIWTPLTTIIQSTSRWCNNNRLFFIWPGVSTMLLLSCLQLYVIYAMGDGRWAMSDGRRVSMFYWRFDTFYLRPLRRRRSVSSVDYFGLSIDCRSTRAPFDRSRLRVISLLFGLRLTSPIDWVIDWWVSGSSNPRGAVDLSLLSITIVDRLMRRYIDLVRKSFYYRLAFDRPRPLIE